MRRANAASGSLADSVACSWLGCIHTSQPARSLIDAACPKWSACAWVQTIRRTSSRWRPTWSSARSRLPIEPASCRPVSTRTIPSPEASAQALPCGTPGQGSGRRRRHTPGTTRSPRPTSLGRVRGADGTLPHPSGLGFPDDVLSERGPRRRRRLHRDRRAARRRGHGGDVAPRRDRPLHRRPGCGRAGRGPGLLRRDLRRDPRLPRWRSCGRRPSAGAAPCSTASPARSPGPGHSRAWSRPAGASTSRAAT